MELGHWGFGAVAAAGYGALPRSWRERPWTGPIYGLALWSGFEAMAPLLGWSETRIGEEIAACRAVRAHDMAPFAAQAAA